MSRVIDTDARGTVRTVQDMAKAGELPGAVKVRRRWTFDLAKLRKMMRDEERRQAQWRSDQKLPRAVSAWRHFVGPDAGQRKARPLVAPYR